MPTTLYTETNDRLTPVKHPEDARWDAGKFGASLTLAKGTVLGKKTADDLLYAYSDAGTTGEQVAVGILMYAIKTNASGKVFLGGDSTTASPINIPQADAPYFKSGVFDLDELTGYDAAALADFKGKIGADGYLYIP